MPLLLPKHCQAHFVRSTADQIRSATPQQDKTIKLEKLCIHVTRMRTSGSSDMQRGLPTCRADRSSRFLLRSMACCLWCTYGILKGGGSKGEGYPRQVEEPRKVLEKSGESWRVLSHRLPWPPPSLQDSKTVDFK